MHSATARAQVASQGAALSASRAAGEVSREAFVTAEGRSAYACSNLETRPESDLVRGLRETRRWGHLSSKGRHQGVPDISSGLTDISARIS